MGQPDKGFYFKAMICHLARSWRSQTKVQSFSNQTQRLLWWRAWPWWRKHNGGTYVYIISGESSKTVSIHHILEPRIHLQSMQMCLGCSDAIPPAWAACMSPTQPLRPVSEILASGRGRKTDQRLVTLIRIELGNHIFFSRRSLSNLKFAMFWWPNSCWDLSGFFLVQVMHHAPEVPFWSLPPP